MRIEAFFHGISWGYNGDILSGLVIWNMIFLTFHSVGNFIIPTDEVIFFRGVGQP